MDLRLSERQYCQRLATSRQRASAGWFGAIYLVFISFARCHWSENFQEELLAGIRADTRNLYFFGPYNADVLINGANVIHLAQGRPILTGDRPVEIAEISNVLTTGPNSIYVTASAGEHLALKIVPAEQGINAQPLVVSDGLWKARRMVPSGCP